MLETTGLLGLEAFAPSRFLYRPFEKKEVYVVRIVCAFVRLSDIRVYDLKTAPKNPRGIQESQSSTKARAARVSESVRKNLAAQRQARLGAFAFHHCCKVKGVGADNVFGSPPPPPTPPPPPFGGERGASRRGV